MSVVEIDPRIYPGSRYPAALNTPCDQIPLTLEDLHTLAASIEAAIKDITGFGPEGETA